MERQNPATLTSQAGNWVLNFVGQAMKPEGANYPNDVSTPETEVRHPKFFFDNILVAIKIENTLFNVHKYQLAKSKVFSDMFKVPNPGGNTPEEGSSPENPIIVKGVAASDFAALLTVLYAGQFTSNQPTPDAPLIVPAFRLANMFNFSELRAFLLPLAEKNLEDVDKIVFAREFDIKEWLAPAHIRLCQREEPLSTEEARKLQVDSTIMISRMRERSCSRNSKGVSLSGSYICYNGNCGYTVNYGSGAHCQYCNTNLDLYYVGSSTKGENTKADNTMIEAEVKKWVEENYVTKKQ
ncbi:unnamed protein product [Rhizoctonia solani]|uniref:BTB domain-containing protein n=1 Tax=Rhizoctonia solani TaxID=456999 RepID=A0A8H3CGQ3_9AGAM|nr:unnamed protein product [Rhizoctonia solani]